MSGPHRMVTVQYARGDRLFDGPGGVTVYGVEASFGTGRGLVWVEVDGTAEIIEADRFRDHYPQAERRRADMPYPPNRRVA